MRGPLCPELLRSLPAAVPQWCSGVKSPPDCYLSGGAGLINYILPSGLLL
ncbi:hypothetical protein [Xylella fastidiosa]|nr:hypothetical protein [Xylella fastidiosa]